jgi:hypothetical protein
VGEIRDNRINLDPFDATTNVVDLTGAGGGAQDTDVFIEGSASIGQITSTSRLGLMYDAGSAQDWSDNIFYFWINCGVVPLLETQSNAGFTIRFCGATVTNWFEVYVGGSDFWPKAVQGGWTQFVVDIEEAKAIGDSPGSPLRGGSNGTSPATSAIRYVGFSAITASVMPKHVDNTWIDSSYRLPRGTPGISVIGNAGGSPEVPYTWDDVLAAADYTDPTKAWGTAKSLDGVIFLNTPVQFGGSGSPDLGNDNFEDKNVVIAFEEQEFIPDGFYGFSVSGDGVNAQRFVAGVLAGEIGSQGWVVVASDIAPRWFIDATDGDISEANFYGCTLIHSSVIDVDNPNADMRNCILIDGQRLWHAR